MSKADVRYIFAFILARMGAPGDKLEVRFEKKPWYSVFYDGKLLGLYNLKSRTFKTAEGTKYYIDAPTYDYDQIGKALANLI